MVGAVREVLMGRRQDERPSSTPAHGCFWELFLQLLDSFFGHLRLPEVDGLEVLELGEFWEGGVGNLRAIEVEVAEVRE